MADSVQICQNCKTDFVILSRDKEFYSKIEVPEPTFCPECRMIRRMCWRNVRSLFMRECSSCKISIMSMYSEERTSSVYCIDCWNSDIRNPFVYGKDYDFSQTFFDQFRKLQKVSPLPHLHRVATNINCDFTNYIANDKDCYLAYSVIDCENILYSEIIDKSKNSLDNYAAQRIDGCSYNVDCENNYNTHYVIQSRNCVDAYFLYDCVNCQDCCLSSNLRNGQYVFQNKKLSKDDYFKEFNKLKLQTHEGFSSAKKQFNLIYKNDAIHRYAQTYNSQNITGDYIGNSKDVFLSFDVQNSENISYSVRTLGNAKDCWDNQGIAAGELVYESIATSFGVYKDKFTYICVGSRECEYSILCKNSSYCFGCIGLTNAQYCIFNKQYTKEEYMELIPKIKKHMMDMPYVDTYQRVYSYGEFFPYEFSPFGYNETNAHDFFPISKEKALEKKYNWYFREERKYKPTILSDDLPQDINNVLDSITGEIIQCPNNGDYVTQCTSAYKINREELVFLKQKKLPLPRLCPNCRHYERLTYRNQMRLHTRPCSNNCGRIFKSTYDGNRAEKVFCEECYKRAIL